MQNYKKYLQSKNLKTSTIKNYTWHLEKFLNWLGEKPLTQDNLQKYFKYLLQRYPRVNTINLRLKIINHYLKFLNKKFQFDLLSHEDSQIRILSKEQLEIFLKNPLAKNNLLAWRDKALLEILYSSGLKVGQIVKIKKQQIDTIKQELFFSKNNFLKIKPSVWMHLKKYLDNRVDDNPYIFINFDRSKKSDNQHISIRSVERIIDKYAKNIKPPVNINPQILRNTLAYNLKSQGAQKNQIKSALHFQSNTGAKNYFEKI